MGLPRPYLWALGLRFCTLYGGSKCFVCFLFSVEKKRAHSAERPEALECCAVSWFYWPRPGCWFRVFGCHVKWQVASGSSSSSSSKQLWLGQLQVPVPGTCINCSTTSTRIFVVPTNKWNAFSRSPTPLSLFLCTLCIALMFSTNKIVWNL